MKKRGVQLSINFIVILILSLAVLSAGLLFANKLLGSAMDIKTDLDASTRSEIESMLVEGTRVGIPFKSLKVARGKSQIFGLGILNVETENTFKVTVTFDSGFKPDNSPICTAAGPGCPPLVLPTDGSSDWQVLYSTDHEVPTNEKRPIPLYFKPPKNAPLGTYIFNVKVEIEDLSEASGFSNYDRPSKINLVVV
ncbi:MAG: hypothetical protein ABIC95_05155 [archaeon]